MTSLWLFTDAIKAPIFALASAAVLVINMIPKNTGPNDVFADIFARSVGAFTTCFAGWYWLSGETDGKASEYLVVLAPVFALIVIIFVVMPVLSHIAYFLLDRNTSKGTSGDE